MNCPDCQKEIPKDSKFCEFCGKKVTKGYAEVIDKITKNGERKNKFRNKILILSLFITIIFFLEVSYDLEGFGIFLAIPMTLLITFVYTRIAKKFNL